MDIMKELKDYQCEPVAEVFRSGKMFGPYCAKNTNFSDLNLSEMSKGEIIVAYIQFLYYIYAKMDNYRTVGCCFKLYDHNNSWIGRMERLPLNEQDFLIAIFGLEKPVIPFEEAVEQYNISEERIEYLTKKFDFMRRVIIPPYIRSRSRLSEI